MEGMEVAVPLLELRLSHGSSRTPHFLTDPKSSNANPTLVIRSNPFKIKYNVQILSKVYSKRELSSVVVR